MPVVVSREVAVSVMPSAAEQLDILRRGVDAITPEPEFVKKLERSVATGKPLRVKYGIDPTGIDVHLGHTVPLRKLRQFQDLGHTAVIIIGNYTALVGDPSGRDETRAALTEAAVEANATTYLEQVGRIIDLSRAEVHRNGDWFGKWSFLDVLDLCRRMTLGQISARDDFAKRIKDEKPVYLHECLYPLMQGWDSVEIRADIELGGTEQLFSLMVARGLQQPKGQDPQVAITLPILVGTDGTRRMGKSLGNYIGVAESAEAQYGKIMSVPDEPLRQYFTLLTDLPLDAVEGWLAPGVNPRDAKDALARAVVSFYHGPEAAEAAASTFRQRAKGGIDLDALPEAPVVADDLVLPGKLLHLAGLVASVSEGNRLVEQGGVWTGPDQTTLDRDRKKPLAVTDGLILGVGKGNKARGVRIRRTS
jgi:tyrosyl-tRNA synthetase